MDTILKNAKLNKVFALIMALLFALSFNFTGINAAVTNDTKGNITVNGVEAGATVELYKIIDVNVAANGDLSHPAYTWVDSIGEWVSRNYSTYAESMDGKYAVTDAFKNTKAEAEKIFLEALSGKLTTATKTQKATSDTVEFADIAMGEYLVKVTPPGQDALKTYQITSVSLVPAYTTNDNDWNLSNAEIVVKSTSNDFEKKVINDTTVNVGDPVNYQLTSTIPNYVDDLTEDEISKLTVKVGDTLSAGLDYALTEGKFAPVVKIGNDTLTAGIDYTLTNPVNGEARKFEIVINGDVVYAHRGKKLSITYSAVVNSNAFAIDTTGNRAYIQQKNDPWSDYNEPTTDEETVYTYGISLTKVDKNGGTLKGAQFELKQNGTALKFTGANGEYVYAADQSNPDATSTLTISDKGKLIIKGIDLGTYTLTETKAANGGYSLPNGDITITLTDATPDGTLDAETETVTASGTAELNGNVEIENNTIKFNVKNTKSSGFELPNTGGMGTLMFTVGGILLMAGAVIFLIVSKKKA